MCIKLVRFTTSRIIQYYQILIMNVYIFLKTPLPIFISDLKLKNYQMSMKRKLFNIDKKPPYSLIGLEKRAALAI